MNGERRRLRHDALGSGTWDVRGAGRVPVLIGSRQLAEIDQQLHESNLGRDGTTAVRQEDGAR